MAIKYCKWDTGSDTTGDGTPGNPYKTIQKATETLVGGDEARVSKNPDPVALSGTIGWVNGQTGLNTSVDLTSELSPGSLIRRSDAIDNMWWEVESVTSSVVWIYGKYYGVEGAVASQKAVPFNTGAAASDLENVQYVNRSGIQGNPILISGGWDLTTPAQVGRSMFKQTGAAYADIKGRGFYFAYAADVTLTKIDFAHYYYGIDVHGGNRDVITDSGGYGCRNGQYLYSTIDGVFSNLYSAGCTTTNFYMSSCSTCTVNIVRALGTYGISAEVKTCNACVLNDVMGVYAVSYGLRVYQSKKCVFNGLVLDQCSSYIISFDAGGLNWFYDVELSNSATYAIYFGNASVFNYFRRLTIDTCAGIAYFAPSNNFPIANEIHDLTLVNVVPTSWDLYSTAYGTGDQMYPSLFVRNITSDAGIEDHETYSGTTTFHDADTQLYGQSGRMTGGVAFSMKYHRFNINVKANTAQTFTFSAMSNLPISSSICQAALYFKGERVVDWTTLAVTYPPAAWQEFSLVHDGSKFDQDGVATLIVRCNTSMVGTFWADMPPSPSLEQILDSIQYYGQTVLDDLGEHRATIEPKLPIDYIMGSSTQASQDGILAAIQAAVVTIDWSDIDSISAAIATLSSTLTTVASNVVSVKDKTDTIDWAEVEALTSSISALSIIASSTASNITLIKAITDTIDWLDIDAIVSVIPGIATILNLLSSRTELALAIENGDWLLSNNQLIVKGSDHITEIARFDLFNKLGEPATEDVYQRTTLAVAGPDVVDTSSGDIVPADVVAGKIGWAQGAAVLGVMLNRGDDSFVPGAVDISIPAGYYNGDGIVEGDIDLVSDNIRAGVTIFGVDGDLDVVDTSSGDAVASEIAGGKVAWVDGAEITGSMVNQGAIELAPGVDPVIIPAGYHNGAGFVQGDADLISGNIRSGITIFGVAGNPNVVNTESGDAGAGEILVGKKAWVDGVELTGTLEGGGGSYDIPKTGQTTSYSAGDDGDLEEGADWPVPRFTDNGDGTVTDNLTGLVWLKYAGAPGYDTDWYGTLIYAAALCNGIAGLTDGSVAGDWKIPNASELQSILDRQYTPALPIGHPFTDLNNYYWSSSHNPASVTAAMGLTLDNTVLNTWAKSTSASRRCWPIKKRV
jgi:hypothetical protein